MAPTGAADASLPGSPPPHPVRMGIIVRRRPATIAVRRSGMQVVSMTLVRGKNCFLVKALMCCSIEGDKVVDLGSIYFVRDAGHEEEHDWHMSKARANALRL